MVFRGEARFAWGDERHRPLKPLHAERIRLPEEWRAELAEALLRMLLLTVNAIAMGQTMTG